MIRSKVNPLIHNGMLYLPHSVAYVGGIKDRSVLEDMILDYSTVDVTAGTILNILDANGTAGYSHTTFKGVLDGHENYYIMSNAASIGNIQSTLAPELDGSHYRVLIAPAMFVFYGLASDNHGTSYVAGGISAIELTEGKGSFFKVRPNTVALYYDKHDAAGILKDENLTVRFSGPVSALSLPFNHIGLETITESNQRLIDQAEVPSMNEGYNIVPAMAIVIARMLEAPNLGDPSRNLQLNSLVIRNAKDVILTPPYTGNNRVCLAYKHEDYSVTVLPLVLHDTTTDSHITVRTDFRSISEHIATVLVYASSVMPDIVIADRTMAGEAVPFDPDPPPITP